MKELPEGFEQVAHAVVVNKKYATPYKNHIVIGWNDGNLEGWYLFEGESVGYERLHEIHDRIRTLWETRGKRATEPPFDIIESEIDWKEFEKMVMILKLTEEY